jgi:ell wall binding domain 2 (CWB2)
MVIGLMALNLNARVRVVVALGLIISLVAVLGGCGKGRTVGGHTTTTDPESATLGYPALATKNTTRIPGADATADAAAAALAVFPSASSTTRPNAVALVDAGNWQAAIAASVLDARPLRVPMLLTAGGSMPAASAAALARLAPAGSDALGHAQVVRVGDATATPKGLRADTIPGKDPATLAAAIDRVATTAAGQPSDAVVVVGDAAPDEAMPAAAWAAKSGDPVLFTGRDTLPAATKAALRRHGKPAIFVLGPASAVSASVLDDLRAYGTVTRISGATPQATAVAFARYSDGDFGWGITDPGHGMVVVNPTQPAAAAAAAALAASGSYGPLLLSADDGSLPDPVSQFLLDIQPGYDTDPVRGVYNHAWLVGDVRAISEDAQSRIDALLEISPVNDTSTSP